ncbi:PqqD family protein [Dermatobacter hominis]|uniref:PqqD family protein n=1 Tax=Dermatobacter hominis TaxID=2884263 RepID=UPI001D118A6B|nr:PqqD family protein [Dermatobacter hominis]UDY33953.1 PqqD family protein [Dermatobacter hominis]
MTTAVPETGPRRRDDAVEVPLGDDLLIGSDLTGRSRVLDPVAAILWSSLDGTVSVDELAADVADALGGDVGARRAQVDEFLGSLREAGLLAGPQPDGVVPRRVHPPLDPTSCVGQRLGLARSTVRQVQGPTTSFRFGANDHHLVDALAAAVPTAEPDDHDLDGYVARLSSGRVARVQQLFDDMGNTLHAGRDAAACAEALARTVGGRLALEGGGAWYEGPSLVTGAGITLVHPAIGHEVVGAFRSELEERGVRSTPSGLVRLVDDRHVELPDDARRPGSAEVVDLVGVVVPGDGSARAAERGCLHLARRWDGDGVGAFVELARSAEVTVVDRGITGGELIDLLVRVAHGSTPGLGAAAL